MDHKLQELLNKLKFNQDGLIPAIVQCHEAGDILMHAWMNEEAVAHTITTGDACYFSRSRQTLWIKGQSSGQKQSVEGFFVDCDYDTILLKVKQKGVACHTGRKSCFFYELNKDKELSVNQDILIPPEQLYGKK